MWLRGWCLMPDVFFRSLEAGSPVYHLIPDWHAGDGRRGGDLVCNIHVYAGTDRVLGSNDGRPLPRSVVGPCGIQEYSRGEVVERAPGVVSTLEVLNKGRMHLNGHTVPLRHAKKFGRPCKTCFPEDA